MDIKNIREPLIMVENSMESSSSSSEQDKDKEFETIDNNLIASIITPDKDIVPNSQNLEPAYIVFENYEKILQWNRSLRFSLAVCTLKEKFENAL